MASERLRRRHAVVLDEVGSGQVQQHVTILPPPCDHHPGRTVCSPVLGRRRCWDGGGLARRASSIRAAQKAPILGHEKAILS